MRDLKDLSGRFCDGSDCVTTPLSERVLRMLPCGTFPKSSRWPDTGRTALIKMFATNLSRNCDGVGLCCFVMQHKWAAGPFRCYGTGSRPDASHLERVERAAGDSVFS